MLRLLATAGSVAKIHNLRTLGQQSGSLFFPGSVMYFGRVPGIKNPKKKERTKGTAIGDDKAAKLSRAEDDAEEKKKKMAAEKIKVERAKLKKSPIRDQTEDFENRLTPISRLKLVTAYNDPSTDGHLSPQDLAKQEALIVERDANDKKNKEKKAKELEEELKAAAENAAAAGTELAVKPEVLTPNNRVRKQNAQLRHKVVVEKNRNVEMEVNSPLLSKLKNIQPSKDSLRTGVVGIKMGMMSTWDKWGQHHPLTVIQLDRVQVVQVKTEERDGYYALQLGVGTKNPKKLKKPEIGHLMKVGIPPKRELQEFRVSKDCLLPEGFMIGARHFTPGQYVDVTGITGGKGFQGAMYRWGFGGGRATHGNSLAHRAHGATGSRQDPGHVFKNKKMAGKMGNKRRVMMNLQIYKIDAPRCLVYVKGSIPGRVGNIVRIRDAIHKKKENTEFLNWPTFVARPDVHYAQEIVMIPQPEDPEEVFIHDNVVIKDEYTSNTGEGKGEEKSDAGADGDAKKA